LVVEAKLIVDGEVFDSTHSKAKQDSSLDPGIDLPAAVDFLRSANFSGSELRFERDKHLAMFIGELVRRTVKELLNSFDQFHSQNLKLKSRGHEISWTAVLSRVFLPSWSTPARSASNQPTPREVSPSFRA